MPRSPILPMNTTPFFILDALWFAYATLVCIAQTIIWTGQLWDRFVTVPRWRRNLEPGQRVIYRHPDGRNGINGLTAWVYEATPGSKAVKASTSTCEFWMLRKHLFTK